MVFLASLWNPIYPFYMFLFRLKIVTVWNRRIQFRYLDSSWSLTAIRFALIILTVILYIVWIQKNNFVVVLADYEECLVVYPSDWTNPVLCVHQLEEVAIQLLRNRLQAHPGGEDYHRRVIFEQDFFYFLENNSQSIDLQLKSENLRVQFHNFFKDWEDLDGVNPSLSNSSYRTYRI